MGRKPKDKNEAPVESVIPEEIEETKEEEKVSKKSLAKAEKEFLRERVLGYLQGRHKLEENDYQRLLSFLS